MMTWQGLEWEIGGEGPGQGAMVEDYWGSQGQPRAVQLLMNEWMNEWLDSGAEAEEILLSYRDYCEIVSINVYQFISHWRDLCQILCWSLTIKSSFLSEMILACWNNQGETNMTKCFWINSDTTLLHFHGNTFSILLTATIGKECTIVRPWQQWLLVHATVLHHTYVVSVVSLDELLLSCSNIPDFLWGSEVCYCIHNSLSFEPLTSVYTLIPCLRFIKYSPPTFT
jgi:hypothetical protein